MTLVERDALENNLDEFSKRLETRIQEFAECGQFVVATKNSGRHTSTSEVLFERFLELMRDLDAKTVQCIARDHRPK